MRLRLRLPFLALLALGCESPAVVMDDAAASPDAIVCDALTQICVETRDVPSVGAMVTAEASGEETLLGTTESNGCVFLDLSHRAWSITARTTASCTSAPVFTNVTGCSVLTVTLNANACP